MYKNIIEFQDGIYLLEKGNFLNKNDIDNTNYISFMYVDNSFISYNLDKQFILTIILKIENFFRADLFQNKKKNINIFLLRIGRIINLSLIFNNELYINKERLYILDYFQEIIQEPVKSSKYINLIDELLPFFILIKLYESCYQNINLFNNSIKQYNEKTKIYIKYGVYHPEIKKFHIDNFILFMIGINNYYLNNIFDDLLYQLNNENKK